MQSTWPRLTCLLLNSGLVVRFVATARGEQYARAMVTKLTENISREVDDIVRVTEALSRDAARSDSGLGPDRVEELGSAVTRLGHVLHALPGGARQHLAYLERIHSTRPFSSMHSEHYEHVSQLCGLAKAVQHQLREGLLFDAKGLIQAEVFDDFLEMADHLLGEGYKDPAAVLIGSVLEDTLRKRSERESLPLLNDRGRKLTIEPLNSGLARAGVYNVLVQKQVTTWADLRNKAAHGEVDQYDAEHVRQMMVGVRKFCADWLP